ncbi:hypothetical protein PENTCL1PPCAC_19258, partial [Pristionchus entomophagus]
NKMYQMSDDFLNGLNIVPIDAKTAKQWTHSAIASPVEHPRRNLFQKREEPSLKNGMMHPETYRAPPYYAKRVQAPRIRISTKSVLFKGRWVTRAADSIKPFAHETIRLCDVVAFRAATANKVPRTHVDQKEVAGVSATVKKVPPNGVKHEEVAGVSATAKKVSRTEVKQKEAAGVSAAAKKVPRNGVKQEEVAGVSATAKKVPSTAATKEDVARVSAKAKKVKSAKADKKDVGGVTAGLARLSTSSKPASPVIYRYIDVIKSSIALLEAIHFDLFMPDRSDLRFLGNPLASVPSGTLEGDYFHVSDANLLSTPSFTADTSNDKVTSLVTRTDELPCCMGGAGNP